MDFYISMNICHKQCFFLANCQHSPCNSEMQKQKKIMHCVILHASWRFIIIVNCQSFFFFRGGGLKGLTIFISNQRMVLTTWFGNFESNSSDRGIIEKIFEKRSLNQTGTTNFSIVYFSNDQFLVKICVCVPDFGWVQTTCTWAKKGFAP